MQPLKSFFKDWRVLLLLLFLLFSIITIRPQIFGTEGVLITTIAPGSSASEAGMQSPSAETPLVNREHILAINNEPVASSEEYYALLQQLVVNQTVPVKTTITTYMLLAAPGGKLGISIADAPYSNLVKGLDLAGGTRVLLKPAEAVTEDEMELIVENLEERLNVYGLSEVVVRSAKDLQGNSFVLVEMAGVTQEEVRKLLESQGKFEAKIDNTTVLTGGNGITYVCRSAECSGIDPQRGCTQQETSVFCSFFFTITLSAEAAERMADATNNLTIVPGSDYLNKDIVLVLDDVEIDSLRIGASLRGRPTTTIQISGAGEGRTQQEALDNTLNEMKRLQTIIATGSLPVKLEIVKLDTISPSLGEEFLKNILLAFLLVLSAVSLVVFVRYRRINVVIPMVVTMIAELVLILGFAALARWNLDLAAIAGLVIVAGTGVDHMIVITDETLRGDQIIDWKRRIKNAMFIVFGAYLTVVAGMLPLWWVGAGLLKGFALTTIAGISVGVLIARPAYAVIIQKLLE